jgi:hypothetical protein
MFFSVRVIMSENLWEEIPQTAWIALGTRGMEQLDLHQCFNPTCPGAVENNVHPLSKESENYPQKENSSIERLKYRMHCDICKTDFILVIDRHKNGENVVMERVSASDITGKSWGEIGWVQAMKSCGCKQ